MSKLKVLPNHPNPLLFRSPCVRIGASCTVIPLIRMTPRMPLSACCLSAQCKRRESCWQKDLPELNLLAILRPRNKLYVRTADVRHYLVSLASAIAFCCLSTVTKDTVGPGECGTNMHILDDIAYDQRLEAIIAGLGTVKVSKHDVGSLGQRTIDKIFCFVGCCGCHQH